MAELPSGTVTFLFTDIEGSTVRWERHPIAMRDALARHDALLSGGITAHGGVVVTERGEGDSFFALFARPSDALVAACALQRALAAEPWPAEVAPLRVRMALHTGDAGMQTGWDYRGATVNRCARLRGAAHGGQVLLSAATYELVRDAVPDRVSLHDLGDHRLKDLARPEHIFQALIPDLPADFPPLKTLDAHRHNLPVQPTALIGREREVAAVRARLREPTTRLLTLTGPGGTGKTRLALQVAAEALDAWRDGVFFVNLAPISDPALVVPTIAQTLGVSEAGSQPLSVTLHAFLRDKQMLLVLDNCERVLDAAPEVTNVLTACAGVRVLATSQATLGLRGERVYPVPPLAVPDMALLPSLETLTQYDAVRLFIARAQDVHPAFAVTNETAPAVAEICVRLDGLPLALELAAARVRLLPPHALLARLSDRLTLLTGGARDLPARQRTLRATIDWSYNLLNAEEQALFARLSVFVGGRTLEAIEAVCNMDGVLNVLSGVESLLEKSLLGQTEVGGETRVVMLETLHEYACERLEASDDAQEVRQRHAAYYLDLSERAVPALVGPQPMQWLERLEVDHDNIRAALTWMLAQGEIALALRLGGALVSFWRAHAHLSEGRQWLEAAVARSDDVEPALRVRAVQGIGWFAIMQDDHERARALLAESLVFYRARDDRHATASVLRSLGTLALLQYNDEQACALLDEALEVYRDVGDQRGVAGCLVSMGQLAYHQGDLERAHTLYADSLASFRRMDSKVGIASAVSGLGEVAVDQGDYERAHTLFQESLALFWEVGVKDGVASNLEELALVAGGRKQPRRAVWLWGVAEALREEIGTPLPQLGRGKYERLVALARTQLTDVTFETLRGEGRTMPLREAIAAALEEATYA